MLALAPLGDDRKDSDMNVLWNRRPGPLRADPCGRGRWLLAAVPAVAQTAIKFSLDFKFEGPAAPFLVAIDKGYFKAEGLDVTIDTAAGSLEPINRVASGTYDMGFGDINSLIKFRDANPSDSDQGRVHGLQQAGLLDRRPQEPRRQQAEGPRGQEARRAGRRRRIRAVEDIRARRTRSTPPRSRSRTSASRCASRCCRAARSTPSPASRSPPSST